ncbi:DUF2147 domain-containing protein [Flavobacteriaceae bacterium S356]|uniref:DUF2147 domain-containing protein n=1 Tax=Asprobacillus argus TaxID=3076534 RepID=A0ABU3LEX5_9FLAO|nr:DUF2147 domain-containing protein [Flavobacteriaceae bacterium S356]
MRTFIVSFIFCFIVVSVNAQTIFGKWNSFDEETKKLESVIEIYKKDGKAYARIFSITDTERQGAICTECKGKKKDKPILGMDILSGLKKKGDEWSGGKILDPKSGKEYKCYIKLLDKNTLKIRGYIGFSMFGRTAIWKRAKE